MDEDAKENVENDVANYQRLRARRGACYMKQMKKMQYMFAIPRGKRSYLPAEADRRLAEVFEDITTDQSIQRPTTEFKNLYLNLVTPQRAVEPNPEEKLNLNCELMIEETPVTIQSEMYSHSEMKRTRKLSEDISKMFGDIKHADVTFIVEEKEIQAHKVILASRSSVFSAMFASDMLEAARNRVDITDLSYDVMMELLRFLYTGSTKKVKENAKEIIIAADKYAVNELKYLCEDALCQQLTVAYVCEMLLLADMYNCNRLESQALEKCYRCYEK